MGLFQRLPDEPADGMALPGEPLDPATPADELPATGAIDVTAFGLGGASGIESVVVALPPTPDE